jgi:hypothetical protein
MSFDGIGMERKIRYNSNTDKGLWDFLKFLIIFEYFPQILIFFDFFGRILKDFNHGFRGNLRDLCEENKQE